MKKFFSLVLALVMALSLTTVAWGATYTYSGGNTGDAAVVLTDGQVYDGANATVTQAGTGSYDSGIAMQGTGDFTIENVTIVSPTRGIETGEDIVSTNIKINNVVIENSKRAIHVQTQSAGNLTVTDSVIAGKVSFVLRGGVATFINCTFKTNGLYEDCLEPWSEVVFINCVFEDGYTVSFEDWNNVAADSDKTIALTDCIYDGEPLTADNVDELFTNTTGVTIDDVATIAATPGVSATLYVWDNIDSEWDAAYIATGMDLDDLKQGADENCLPCYLVDGDYFVETTANAAVCKLVYGAKTIYLKSVDASDVCYAAKASAYTNITKKTDVCGKLVVTDTTKAYFASYDENTETYTYYAGTKNGSIQLLVGGKIVDVELNPVQALTGHAWDGYDVVDHAYVNVKCANCGKVAKLYATGTAAGKDSVKVDTLGYITKLDNGFGASVTVGTTTGSTVQSAQTFDAGIAMYVGMSVMAAAGSVVVIGKKKD